MDDILLYIFHCKINFTGAPVMMIVIALIRNIHIFDGYFDDQCRLRFVYYICLFYVVF